MLRTIINILRAIIRKIRRSNPPSVSKVMIHGGHSKPMLSDGDMVWGSNLKQEVVVLLGQIIRSWAMIGFTIDSSIRSIIDNRVNRQIDTSLIEPFNKRIDLLSGLCEEVCANEAHVKFVHGMLQKIKSEQKLRNMLVHARVMDDTKRPQTHVHISSCRWTRPPRKIIHKKISIKALEDYYQRTQRLAMELFMAAAHY